MKIYTRTGDDGTTSIGGSRRLQKCDDLIEALGEVDELISWIALLRDSLEYKEYKNFLVSIQKQLMMYEAVLAGTPYRHDDIVTETDYCSVEKLEQEIDRLEIALAPLTTFIIPGGHIIISYCHIARCVCRRAERRVVKLMLKEKSSPLAGIFLNRLADYLFVLSRKISLDLGIEEIKLSGSGL
ncbi:MAG: cob(I)yrinic acid a,c-diamide adenosyltransferase [Bacteroidetes bacterium]|nr:cob(I)yrinic acid a,c-diamide adenosyltransferase [Bacteroidota bacterium]